MTAVPVIVISAEGEGFSIDLVPPVEGLAFSHFDTHRAVFGFAVGLRLTNGWRIEDRTVHAPRS